MISMLQSLIQILMSLLRHQFFLPEVKANDGYRLAGWTVEGKESIKLDANATTLGFAGLAHFNDGENVGYISVEPVFEEVKEEKSSSS